MIWTKRVHQSAKFQTFDCSSEISPNLYFDRLLLLKIYKISAKKVQRSCVSWHWRVIKSLKKNWIVVSRTTRILLILTRALKILKNLHFEWFVLCKVYNVWHKKSTKELLLTTPKSDAKFEEKKTCVLENDMRNLANFHQSTWKSQNWDFDGILSSKVKNA